MAEQHGKALVPQIRFAGFTDPWEQRKLGELFEESDERASDREILSVSVANGIYPASESDRETNPGASLANYKIVHFGDVVYNSMRMWQGAVDASRYDGIVSPAYVVTRPNSEVYARFFARLLRQPMLLKQYQQVSQGNSKDTQVLKFDDFASIGISMPASENEQRQIGAFFDRLDSLITLHQRKYDKLCVLKKSMLDKMFPKGGSLYPEIRFAGFTDPWEQRKLGEVARRVTRKNENRDSDLPLTISAQYGLVDQRTFFNNQVASKDMSGYFLLRKGEFAYNKSTSTDSPWGAIKRLEKYDMGCVSTLYICFELLSGDPDFLVTYYETDRWYKAVQLIAAEGARNHGLLNIAPDDFFETQICIPKRIDEQRQIGAFFDRLDSLITLHQRKYCGVVSWMLGVALVRLGSESDGAFGEMKHVLR
ncbi:restriction endonuclease subunit S [Bifidobacterium adolescentis]